MNYMVHLFSTIGSEHFDVYDNVAPSSLSLVLSLLHKVTERENLESQYVKPMERDGSDKLSYSCVQMEYPKTQQKTLQTITVLPAPPVVGQRVAVVVVLELN
ncbi:hypothetical protein VNO77_12160 [Canavalia gladiata]|uniref:Uncharacterized protein n=1 Tax=Canavalia gladiata TaxID=3824 RepID=A0AAN9LVY4_CANGL